MVIEIPLSKRKISHYKKRNDYMLRIPPAIGRALESKGITHVDVIIIVPDTEASSNQSSLGSPS